MAEPITVTIITATFNSEQYVEDTIRSVVNQTYPHIEYIIVDGSSTDGTLSIVNRYADRIRKIISEPDKGVYDAFNKGIQASTGALIYFLNSDDYLYDDDTIGRVVERFEHERTINAVYGNILRREPAREIDQIYGREFGTDDFVKGYMPPHQALFVRREMFARYGTFDLQYRSSSDFDFISKLYLNEKANIRYVGQTIAVFRIGGLSTHYRTRMIGMRETEALIQRHFGAKVDLSATEIANNALFRHWLESLLLENKGITAALRKQGVTEAAIFGTMKTAHYLLKDMRKEDIHVAAFIDNNVNMQGKRIEGIPIVPSAWLAENIDRVNAVVVSLESESDKAVMQDLERHYGRQVKVVSWKQLI
jgi:glycosyltransferase involved in cell wall biosynthesis